MFKLPVYNQEGKEVKKIELDPEVFDGKVNHNLIYQAVLMYRANRRKGLASTKTRGEVSGGGVKPWRQKGTGRARVGSIRSPLWRKGGVVFGPHPRDYSFSLPKKIKLAALKSSLNARLKETNMIILEDLKITNPKTKEGMKILNNLKINRKKSLLLLNEINETIKRCFGNIGFLTFVRGSDVNAYDILKASKLMITEAALNSLIKRLKG